MMRRDVRGHQYWWQRIFTSQGVQKCFHLIVRPVNHRPDEFSPTPAATRSDMNVPPSVSTVTVCDLSRKPFPSFKHETTTYVSIPHGASSQVVVQWNGSCQVCINSNGNLLFCESAATGKVAIGLSGLSAPMNRLPIPIPSQLKPLIEKYRPTQLRLYAFAVEIQSDSSEHRVLSSTDFHILCPDDFNLAQRLSLELESNPRAIDGDLISDRAEGQRCAQCSRIRKNL
jgi:hypothetical protein